MGNLWSILYLCAYLLAGWLLARRALPQAGPEHTVPLGCAFGVALLAMLPAAFALALGFGLAAALAALALVLALAALAWRGLTAAGPGAHSGAAARGLLPLGKSAPANHAEAAALLAVCVPGVVLTAWLLYTHVLRYDPATEAYYTGQSGYGDVAMHLAFIKSIAVQGKMPPAYSLLAGQELFGYPFLCESVSSVFLLLGAGLKFAYILPEIPALVSIFCFVWLLARQALGGSGKAVLASALFFLGGGFGFAYFMGSGQAFRSIFTGYYTTPTNYVEQNIRWVNCIADLLVPQRATLMGWALMLPCLYLLHRFAFAGETRLWLPLGLLAGCLPLMQTHSLLALVLMSAVYLLRPLAGALRAKDLRPLLPWLGYAAVAGALCLPQLCGIIFRQTGTGSGFLQPVFNWANHGTGESYVWFYIKNLGLIWLVQIPAYLWAKQPLRRFYRGGLAVLAVSEFVVFQPNYYDNIKLLFFWFLCACLLAANALWDWLALLPKAAPSHKAVRAALAALVLAACTLSSILTLGRELVSNYQVFSADAIALAEYVDENTPSGALFLTGQQHLNPVASLAGRNILCGSTLYVHFHGMDYGRQADAVRQLYETPSQELLALWGVEYVLFSSYERADYAADEAWYAARYPVEYQRGEYTLYRVAG